LTHALTIGTLATVLMVATSRAQSALPLPVLLHPASARALALGGASVVLDGDDAAIFSNAALLGRASAGRGITTVGLSLQPYLASSTLSALSATVTIPGWRVGVGVQALDYGSSPEIIPDESTGGEVGTETGATVSAGEFALVMGAATSVGRHVIVGASAKALHQSIAGESGTDAAVDLGAAAALHGITVALSAQNLGRPFTLDHRSAALPRLLRAGAVYDVPLTPTFTITPDAEVTALAGGDYIRSAGVESSWKASSRLTAQLRVGYRDASSETVASPVTFGGGLTNGHLSLDYAYQRLRGVAANTQRIGVRWTR
jgi:hypothetical protein